MATTEDRRWPGADLTSWRDGPAKRAIVEFVARVCGADGSEPVPVEERVAVFDNDGTLWCEKPMPIQLDFILRRLVEMAEADPALRERQPWKAAHERDYGWLGAVMAEHYAGDDTNVQGRSPAASSRRTTAISVEDFEAQADAFLRSAQHPTLGRGYLECAYAPMVELLGYLEANGFSNYIASGGGRDFMRPISQDVYGIPRERVIGSSAGARVHQRRARRHDHPQAGGRLPRRRPAEADPHLEPHRPPAAAGRRQLQRRHPDARTSPSTPTSRTLRLLVLHDDAEREFAYTAGAEQALEQAARDGWTVVSVKNDWATVF